MFKVPQNLSERVQEMFQKLASNQKMWHMSLINSIKTPFIHEHHVNQYPWELLYFIQWKIVSKSSAALAIFCNIFLRKPT